LGSGPQTNKHMPQSPFTVNFFMTKFRIDFCESYLSAAIWSSLSTKTIKKTLAFLMSQRNFFVVLLKYKYFEFQILYIFFTEMSIYTGKGKKEI
jgi:hypothetical protein